jgi:hypothetical protein
VYRERDAINNPFYDSEEELNSISFGVNPSPKMPNDLNNSVFEKGMIECPILPEFKVNKQTALKSELDDCNSDELMKNLPTKKEGRFIIMMGSKFLDDSNISSCYILFGIP